MAKFPRTLTRDRSPLEVLAIRPESDEQDILLLLAAYGKMIKRSGTPQQIYKTLLADRRKRALPVTPEDHFTDLLQSAVAISSPTNQKQGPDPLREAREWLIGRNRQLELEARRKRGARGGRPSNPGIGSQRAHLAQAIQTAAIKALAQVPGLATADGRRLVEATAKRITVPGYRYASLDKKAQKQRRDYVRKVLKAKKWLD
jgi:hypothetical protein